ncbi:MAG: YihY/virulence factor BrkB family protein [Nocardioides sp.]|nr:YihY/virulence factor BrkB family protein [Nocardioides sp.]
MGRVADGLDGFQRRHRVLGVPIAVIYKFFDDQSNYLAAIMTYYAFIAIFPLLLLASSIFGFILQGRPELQQEVLNSALSQFPIIGDQLNRPEGLRGSSVGAVVGALAALYGSLGLGQAIQNAMNVAWSVPRNSRPNPFLLRLKSLALLLSAGLAVLAVSVLSALGSNTQVFGRGTDLTIRILISVATLLLVGTLMTLLFRFAVARHLSFRKAAPGAFVVAILWQFLQYVGATYATHVLAQTTAMNKNFGLVLGLIGLIYLAAVMAMLGIQVNVVLVRRLWPRALLTPFTDSVELTEADRRAYAGYARAQRHKGFESVEVTFDKLAAVRDDIPD